MMLFVDASTLILTAKAGLLDMFIEATKERLAISAEVEREATRKHTFDALLIRNRIDEKKIEVKKVRGHEVVKNMAMDFSLHKGEAETMVLCMESRGKGIATDDYSAMKACTVLGINYITSLGILLKLYQGKKLSGEEAKLKLDLLIRYGRYSSEIIGDFAQKLEG